MAKEMCNPISHDTVHFIVKDKLPVCKVMIWCVLCQLSDEHNDTLRRKPRNSVLENFSGEKKTAYNYEKCHQNYQNIFARMVDLGTM